MFFNKLKQLCDKNGITPYKACIDIGLNRAAVAKWKKGSTPNGATVQKFAGYFGVPIGYLRGEAEGPDTDDEQKKEPVPETISLRDERRLKAIELYNQLTPEGEEMALALLRTLVEQSGK